MTKMLTVLAAVALLASSAVADTPNLKTYKVTLSNPSRIGTNELAPGDYKMAVDTASVRILDVRSGKAVEVAAAVETSETKFGNTAITSEKIDGVDHIKEIRLGGSKISINFR